jgi:septal ring factor EnvC (AmiA/AmiB activator)
MISSIKKQTYVVLFIYCLLMFFGPTTTFAGSTIEKLSEIKKSIKSRLIKIKKDKKKEESLQSKIKNIQQNIGSKEREIKKFEKGIASTNKEIDKLSSEIDMMADQMENRKLVVKEYLRALHKRQFESDMIFLISAADYQDFVKKSRYISLIADHNSKIIHSYKEDLARVKEKKNSLENLQASLESKKATARVNKKKLQSEKKKKKEIISTVRSRRIAHEKKIRELEESSKKLQSMVTRLQSKKMPGAIVGDGFKSHKGVLPWPVDGRVLTKYGKHKDQYDVLVNKSGINISVDKDENPRAVAGGRVVFTGNFEGYGNLLIIDHGNGYHSLYGNLSKTSIKEDSLLVEGMNIGSVSSSKQNKTPVLYFEIRHKGRPVDPLKWLQSRS